MSNSHHCAPTVQIPARQGVRCVIVGYVYACNVSQHVAFVIVGNVSWKILFYFSAACYVG
jgi:glutamate mutase epsilon subunit